MERFAECMRRVNLKALGEQVLTYSASVGPNTALWIPAGWILAERCNGTANYGLRCSPQRRWMDSESSSVRGLEALLGAMQASVNEAALVDFIQYLLKDGVCQDMQMPAELPRPRTMCPLVKTELEEEGPAAGAAASAEEASDQKASSSKSKASIQKKVALIPVSWKSLANNSLEPADGTSSASEDGGKDVPYMLDKDMPEKDMPEKDMQDQDMPDKDMQHLPEYEEDDGSGAATVAGAESKSEMQDTLGKEPMVGSAALVPAVNEDNSPEKTRVAAQGVESREIVPFIGPPEEPVAKMPRRGKQDTRHSGLQVRASQGITQSPKRLS